MARTSYIKTDAQQHITDAREKLERAVLMLYHEDAWAEYLRMQARFYQYSYGNSLLITIARPDATHVASYKKWLDLGRQVKKGETGIRIITPRPWSKTTEDEETGETTSTRGLSFGTAVVFDILQTHPLDGHPHPFMGRPVLNITGAQESGDEAMCQELITELEAFNEARSTPVEFVSQIASSTTAMGCYYPGANRIEIVRRECAPMLATLIHETAHAVTKNDMLAGTGKYDYVTGEVVAEAVSFIVCERFGIEALAPASEYIAQWIGADMAHFKKALTFIQQSAAAIIDALESEPSGSGA